MPEATALAIMQDGNLAGYGVIRTCRQGYKIGPLLADTPGLAETLEGGLLGCEKGPPPFGEPHMIGFLCILIIMSILEESREAPERGE